MRGRRKISLEGDPMIFGIVMEFSSVEGAKNYYKNEDYEKALKGMGEDVRKTLERNMSVFEVF